MKWTKTRFWRKPAKQAKILTPAELQAMLELDARRDPADAALLEKIDQSDAEAYADPPRAGRLA